MLKRIGFALATSFVCATSALAGDFQPSSLPSTQGWPLVYAETWQSLSLRNGGPTWAGYSAGKGSWFASATADRSGSTAGTINGYADYGHGYFVDPFGTGWPASYSPLGQITYTAPGSVKLRISPQSAAIQALNASWLVDAAAVSSTDLSPNAPGGGSWYGSNGGSEVAGTAVDGLPPPAVITNSNDYGGIETCCSGNNLTAGVAYQVNVKFNFGSSGVIMAHPSGAKAAYIRVTSAGVISVSNDPSSGTGGDAEISNVVLSTVASHKELTFIYTPGEVGQVGFRLGPGSNTASTTVSVYKVDFIVPGGHPQQNKGLSALLNSAFTIKPPYEIVGLVKFAPTDTRQWPAFWTYGKDAAGLAFEMDAFEYFAGNSANQPTSTIHYNSTLGGTYYSTSPAQPALPSNVPIMGGSGWTVVDMRVDTLETIVKFNGITTLDVKHSALNAGADPVGANVLLALDMAFGFNYLAFPGDLTSDITTEFGPIYVYAPTTNTSAVVPPTPPVPATAFIGSYGTSVPHGATTTIANLSGASTYTLLARNPSGFSVSGSTLVMSSSVAAGTYLLYIQGTNSSGVPAIMPALTVTVT